jgi:hypothetical protein
MTSVISLGDAKKPKTPPELAQAARDELERLIGEGILCVLFVVEQPAGVQITSVPKMDAIVWGLYEQAKMILEEDDA